MGARQSASVNEAPERAAPDPYLRRRTLAFQDYVRDLCFATNSGNFAQCREIVRICGKQVIAAPNHSMWTAVHCAALCGHHEILAWFLQQSIDANIMEAVCTAALSVATISGHTACVRILLSRGAGITVKNRDGKTAIDLARERGRTAILDLLEEHELLLGQRRIKPALREPFKPLAPAQEDPTEAARILVLDFEGMPLTLVRWVGLAISSCVMMCGDAKSIPTHTEQQTRASSLTCWRANRPQEGDSNHSSSSSNRSSSSRTARLSFLS
eukprot:m.737121 g.737121  ORF g.737121 m.737121 type:complete len:270 (-) comp58903_c0_seq10:141-950(-)